MSELLKAYSAGFVREHPGQAVPHVQSTLAKLWLCRTPALGTHRYRCPACEVEATVYNSCGCSQCPRCAGTKRAAWKDSTSKLLLDGVTYFQVVFTMPDKLSSLALGNRRAMFGLLFRSAWSALRDTIADEQGFEAAAAMVLHTWNQRLEPHVHVHALVPGGGPALGESSRWVRSQRRRGPRLPGAYLVNADDLRLRFRTTFLAGLKRLHRKGKLKLQGDWSHLQSTAAFDEYLQPMEQVKWGTFIQAPPVRAEGQPESSPEHVLKYLARYMTGGPISDRRLVSHKDGKVTFMARKGDEAGGSDEQVPVTLPGVEFVRRWAMHILPKGMVKTRRYGGFSNHHWKRYLAECRDLLPPPEPESSTAVIADTAETEPPTDNAAADDPFAPKCPRCDQPMQCVTYTDRPSWRDIMSGPDRPKWYDDG